MATLLVLAREQDEEATPRPYDDSNDDLDDYRLWVVFKHEADVLRKEIDTQERKSTQSQLAAWCKPENGLLQHKAPVPGPSQAADVRGRHCDCCRCKSQEMTLVRRGPKSGSELLPELPWYYQKGEYINSAAFETR